MTNEAIIEKIETIQNKQTRYKLIFGTFLGMILLVYFFTFAMFVDKFPPAFFMVELITTPIIFALFFFLNHISFALIRGGFEKQDDYRDLIKVMSRSDLDVKPEKIAERL